jgi:hypothetical protein
LPFDETTIGSGPAFDRRGARSFVNLKDGRCAKLSGKARHRPPGRIEHAHAALAVHQDDYAGRILAGPNGSV